MQIFTAQYLISDSAETQLKWDGWFIPDMRPDHLWL